MKKIQSFIIAKFQSSRLREFNYKIDVTLNDLRRNNEIIRLSDNQILRTLRQVTNKPFYQNELNDLIKQKRKLSKELNSKKELLEVIKKIDDILYVPEIISIHFDNPNYHYKKIIKDGVYINSHRFVRLWAGAGMLRKNTVNFVREDLKDKLVEILDNGRNKEIPLVSAKYSAYFSLNGSSSTPISFPRICVIPDKIDERETKVNFVYGEGKETNVEERIIPIKFNLFDGQGLMSCEYAEKISRELELDYNLSWIICRSSFVKGLLINFDFKNFNYLNGNQKYITDIYGDQIEIENIDVILSESQFKLWNCYSSTQEYVNNCKKNNILFGASRISPSEKDEKKHVFSNYQFTQILSGMDDERIESFCKPTVDYLNDLIGSSQEKMLLYMLGSNINNVDKDYFFDSIQDNSVKALMINANVKNDPYILQKFKNSLSKTIRESSMGKTLHCGNFSIMYSDPSAQVEHALGLEVKGILKRGEYYSNFWNVRNVKKVVSMRAPLVHSSEGIVLDLVKNNQTEFWFENMTTGIVFPIDGEHTLFEGGADFDGDSQMTTNDENYINGLKIDNLPIYYAESKAKKEIVTDETLYKADLGAFNTRVGFVTNVSSSIWSMLDKFEIDSPEYIELSKRLMYLRREQGFCVDGAKGILVPPFPEHFIRYEKQNYSLSEEEQKQIEFFNRCVCKKRPLFFIRLYSSYNKKYIKEIKSHDAYSRMKFKLSWEELLKKENKSQNEENFIQEYYNKSFFSHEKSIMNKVMAHIDKSVKEIKNIKREFDPNIYMNHIFEFNETKYEQLKMLYLEYGVMKKEVRDKGFYNDHINFDDFLECVEYLKKKCLEIGSFMELIDLAVKITYIDNKNGNKGFLWDVFGDQIVDNLLLKSDNNIYIPTLDNNGSIDYLWQRYSIKELSLNKLEEGKIL